MESVGYTAIDEDPAVDVKSSWNQADFAAGGLVRRFLFFFWGGKCIMHRNAYGVVCGTPAWPARGLLALANPPTKTPTPVCPATSRM